MKLEKLKLKNFRGYNKEVEINFSNLDVFVGKNDIGKSTILEALDIFFNDGKGIKIDKEEIKEEITTQNIVAKNENMEVLKRHFSNCFDKNGNFDKFKQERR